ncbi:hypothetical protein PMX22_18665 [Clostridium butyricum]|uniref:hypothetical protein n=1 Tax=Clostridium butyricum TaxID=1492 RepID=UPI00232DC108|nr:hypothetical protein [Clostridium butyricum]MDB2161815.1 hypothetical protein [Clostridium butyricum]
MNNKQVIEQLRDLKKDRESFLTEGADEVYKKDIEAIDIAICVLERTAPEVPVQEQHIQPIESNIGWIEKLSKSICSSIHDTLSK